MSSPRRSVAFVVVASSVVAAAVFAALGGLLYLLERVAVLMPAQSPTSLVNEHGQEVYAAIAQPPVPIATTDITTVYLGPDSAIKAVDPFTQLVYIGTLPITRYVVLPIVFVLVILILVNSLHRLNRRPHLNFVILSAWVACSAAIALFVFASRAARGTWDEIYVFASQARNFAATGIAAVPTTGPGGVAESSSDWGITMAAGVILKFAPGLAGETALVVALAIIIAALTFGAILALRYWFSFGRVLSILVPLAFIGLLPQSLLASAQAVPTGVAAGALALFALVLLHALRTGKVFAFALYSVPLAVIRWEFGILLAISAAVLITAHLWRRRRNETPPWARWEVALVAVPVVFLGLETLYRLALFGSVAPSGVLVKGMGVDGAYIRSGLEYLVSTSGTNLWPLMLCLAVTTAVLTHGFRNSRSYLIVVVIVLLPLANSIVAGGDWFPREWERYVLPSYTAVLIVTFATFGELIARREKFRFSLVPVALVYLLSQSLIVSIMYTDYVSPELPGRTNCLARAGLAIARVVPAEAGIASAEVNTVAYFADAPLTDLIGLVDSRVATAPPSPMTHGDLLHRKTVPEDIYTDRPGAIYLYEGADCSGQPVSQAADTQKWDSLLNYQITQYRTGDLRKLLDSYHPITIRVQDGILVRVLVRNDLVPE